MRVFTLLVASLLTGCSGSGPFDGDPVKPTSKMRTDIEQQVRTCGMKMQSDKWVWHEDLDQWEFGFNTTALDFADSAKSRCIRSISLPTDHSVMIAFTGPNK
jgi:hypothetical protein